MDGHQLRELQLRSHSSIRDAVGTIYPGFLLCAGNVHSSDPDTALLRADSVKGLPHLGSLLWGKLLRQSPPFSVIPFSKISFLKNSDLVNQRDESRVFPDVEGGRTHSPWGSGAHFSVPVVVHIHPRPPVGCQSRLSKCCNLIVKAPGSV